MPDDFLKSLFLPAALIFIMFGMGMSLALAIALGMLESARIAMPAVVYSLLMFASGGWMMLRAGCRFMRVR